MNEAYISTNFRIYDLTYSCTAVIKQRDEMIKVKRVRPERET